MDKIAKTDRQYNYKSYELNPVSEAVVLGTYQISSLDNVPVDLKTDHLYTLSRWDRVIYARAISSHQLEVLEAIGGSFLADEEYLIILPRY